VWPAASAPPTLVGMSPTDARLEALSAAVRALAAALPPDQAGRAAQALREAVGALV
jgi:hypothetical protein